MFNGAELDLNLGNKILKTDIPTHLPLVANTI